MGCLASAQSAIDSAKGAVDSARSNYESQLSSLRSLNPSSFTSRVDFEAAKASAISSVQSSLSSYLGAIDGLRSAGGLLSAVSGANIEALADLTKAVQGDITGLIPGGPSLPGSADTLLAAAKGLQC